jgi:hypothetical protein
MPPALLQGTHGEKLHTVELLARICDLIVLYRDCRSERGTFVTAAVHHHQKEC